MGGVLRPATSAILAAVIGTGLAPMFLYETEYNAPYLFVFRHLAIPVMASAYAVPLVLRWRPRGLTLLALVFPAMVGLMVVLWLCPAALWPNALVGRQR